MVCRFASRKESTTRSCGKIVALARSESIETTSRRATMISRETRERGKRGGRGGGCDTKVRQKGHCHLRLPPLTHSLTPPTTTPTAPKSSLLCKLLFPRFKNGGVARLKAHIKFGRRIAFRFRSTQSLTIIKEESW